ncbi:MAG: pyridoxine 5'-phosphate synthase [Pelagibacteraceae bacterium]
MKLGVNIDHIATLRNARGLNSPSILRALKECEKNHVDTITVHLREDRRHISDSYLRELKKNSKTQINIEMALTKEIIISAFVNPDKKMILLAKKLGFHAVEIHTGALDKLNINKKKLNNINNMIKFAHSIELVVNIGHGLNFNNIKLIKNKKIIDTVHIGHFIISEAIFLSLSKTIKKFQHLIKS